jgi:sulfopropanediol 3-dehydrogenase
MFGSAQMSSIPAKVTGVKTVVACPPPVKGEGYFPATINAVRQAGADRIFILDGVPALALMAFGLDFDKPVDILCRAGNKYVAEAKQQLIGRCGIDSPCGTDRVRHHRG